MSTPSQRLRAKVDLLQPSMEAAAAAFWTHPSLRTLFPEFLMAIYSVVQASVPLLRLAAARCGESAASDPVAAALAGYFAAHAEEEIDHDIWLLEDLEALGFERAAVRTRPPSATVAALVGSQYFWIHHYHPVSFLGHLAVVERPVRPESYRLVMERTGLPKQAFRTLLYHATVDAGHEQDLNRHLDSLPLTPAHESAIGMSAMVAAGGTAALFRDVVDGSA